MFTNDDRNSVVMPIGHKDLSHKIFSSVYGVPRVPCRLQCYRIILV